MITKAVNLWLGSGPRVVIPVSQFDTAWEFVFTIINAGTEWTIPAGSSVVMNGLKPDGNVFAFSGIIVSNKVVVDADVQMTACAGDTICELSILADGLTVGTANFTLAVEAAPKSPNDVSSDSTLPAYAEMLEMFSGDITDAVDDWLDDHSGEIGGLSNEAKQALLTLLDHVAYTDDQGQTYLDALEAALYPPADLVSISAVFNQGSTTIYDTDTLDTLRQYLTVTALYSDSSTEVVTAYTLSGVLIEGTRTITASYGGKSDTFTVTVTEANPSLYKWDFTQSTTDSKQGATATLSSGLTRDSNGISFTTESQYIDLGAIFARGRSYEFDFTNFDLKSDATYTKRLIMYGDNSATGTGPLIWRKASYNYWTLFNGNWSAKYGDLALNAFANSTVKITVASTGYATLYLNGTLIGTSTRDVPDSTSHLYIGNSASASASGDIHDCTITGVRVYEEV